MYFLLITAFTVSIDSFLCGFSLSYQPGKKLPIVLGIAVTVFVMCLLTNYATTFFAPFLSEKIASLGGIILVGVGIYTLFSFKKEEKCATGGMLKQSVVTGFAVGLDGAFANLSLSLMGMNALYVPIIIAVMHAAMIALGIALAGTSFCKIFKKISFVPPIILIILGVYKLIGFFI